MSKNRTSVQTEILIPSTGHASTSVTLWRGPGALLALEDAWRALEDSMAVPAFQRFDWARIWLAHLHAGGEAWFLVAGDPVRGILPLVRESGSIPRRLSLVGHGISDYVGPICDDPEIARALGAGLGRLSSRVDAVVLKGISAGDPATAPFLDGIDRPMVSRIYEQCPAIATSSGWDQYLTERPKKFRANLKHTARRVEELGDVTVGVETPSPSLFDEMLEVEQASWKWEGGFAFLNDPIQREFFRDIVLCDRIPQQLWTCRIDGVLAAFAQLFTVGDRWHYYWPSFRAEMKGVGMYLMAELVEECCNAGMAEFDFLGGDEAYKLRWTTHTNHTSEIIVRGRAPVGSLVVAAYRTRWRLAESERLREMRRKLLVRLKRNTAD